MGTLRLDFAGVVGGDGVAGSSMIGVANDDDAAAMARAQQVFYG